MRFSNIAAMVSAAAFLTIDFFGVTNAQDGIVSKLVEPNVDRSTDTLSSGKRSLRSHKDDEDGEEETRGGVHTRKTREDAGRYQLRIQEVRQMVQTWMKFKRCV
ncbi:hypothetical protein F441_19587 [Phytophthora nicotianae CJ01A1]|uniref:RxLR effector protein n=2 Tax=Phytophthora nicotianae TaxID=4792 RepID=W2HZH0_PHYNI|nr:hypothetical protein L915_11045 [Phytophthora nicotianae]ETL27369.1 hypothetical protein L916_19080 [Phytophthora nicotianae]ETP03456.1 hypothetical protein F441_19587 [Phytophthora nicotianae CJ01A1]